MPHSNRSRRAERDIRFRGAEPDAAAERRPAVIRSDVHDRHPAFTDNEPDWEARAETLGVGYLPVDPADARARALCATTSRGDDAECLVIPVLSTSA